MIHPIAWPDIIIGVVLAEGIIYTVRATIKHLERRARNQMVAYRVDEMRPAALDNYRAAVKENVRAPLG